MPGTHRTFPVVRTVPGKGSIIFSEFSVPLFKWEQGRYGEPLFPHFSDILYLPKLKKYINLIKSN